MSARPQILALIPARGGSKRVPRKNLADLGGRPLIEWTIEAALGARLVDRVVVSTDDDELAGVSRDAGADVPFRRPAELATDTSDTAGVVLHALGELAGFDAVVLLQPTSPLRTAGDVDGAIETAMARSADTVMSVCEVDHPVEWTTTLGPEGELDPDLAARLDGTRSQDLPRRYRLNGAVYVFERALVERTRSLRPGPRAFAYVMPRDRSVDIDTPLDLRLAGLLLAERRRTGAP